MSEFLTMGGYAPYVWGSYGLALLVLVALLVASLLGLRDRERTLRALEAAQPRRRRKAREAAGGDAGAVELLPMTGGLARKPVHDDAPSGDTDAGDGGGSGGDSGGGGD